MTKVRDDRPVPERRVALLWCDALGRPTWHRYHGTRAAGGHDRPPVWEHVYACTQTGTSRVWGCADREVAERDAPLSKEHN